MQGVEQFKITASTTQALSIPIFLNYGISIDTVGHSSKRILFCIIRLKYWTVKYLQCLSIYFIRNIESQFTQ